MGKIFVPLENNPEVMNPLGHKLGLSKKYAFHDMLSLNEPSLLSLIPRPCYAVLFTLPITSIGEKNHADDEEHRPIYNGKGTGEPILWFHQTITHACGLFGLLHCITNTQLSDAVERPSHLEGLISEATPLTPAQRSQLLYDSDTLEAAHSEAAQTGDSVPPIAEEYKDGNAFVAFVKGADGHLWELESRRKGPVDRGVLEEGEDLLSERALDLGPRAHVKTEIESGNEEFRFSCLALSHAD